jgi:ATPase subunit of ABC transporter with duplicated ATPase domains
MLVNHLPPKLILLDEPTNNLDIESIQELTLALNNYNGALIVISDYCFQQYLVESAH